MPQLENPKHEAFAQNLARGMKQGDAYIKAGYSKNAGAASRLAASPKVQDRVEEVKKEIHQKVVKAMEQPNEETWGSLAEMGLTMEWVALQYKTIYSEALNAGAFAAANTAVQNIQKLIEIERNGTEDERPETEDKISVKDTLAMLREMKNIIHNAPEDEPDAEPIDITPKEDELSTPSAVLEHFKDEE